MENSVLVSNNKASKKTKRIKIQLLHRYKRRLKVSESCKSVKKETFQPLNVILMSWVRI
jgi:hypothetical protein